MKSGWLPEKDTIIIVTKARDNKLVDLTFELSKWLIFTPRFGKTHPFKVFVDDHLRHSKQFQLLDDPIWQSQLKYWCPKLCYEQPDLFHLIITLGGDGTILFTSTLFQTYVPPIMPFHLGSLGFLAPFSFGSYRNDLNNLFEGTISSCVRRMRLDCTVYRHQFSSEVDSTETNWIQTVCGGKSRVVADKRCHVLNEIVVDRGPSANMSLLELFADERHLTTVQADGLCIATPTGSTAYSLSANGSLTHPDMQCTLVTPVCPHTLSFRPMLLPSSVTIRITVPYGSKYTAHCRFDGRNTVKLKQGEHVKIKLSPYPVYTYSASGISNDWFSSVQACLHWNVRERQKQPADTNSQSFEQSDILIPWTEQELGYTLNSYFKAKI
ncbi:ATP-NAD kinase-like domain-containing protein [Sporodiniella umbellata]|nr:ATP-NAD kinase-like domain-containing protein [Sporodiniella umbellata]